MPRTGLAEADIDDLPLYTPFAWDDADKREAVRAWDEVFGFRKRRELGRGTYLFREGLLAREVFLLVDGLILLTCTAPVTESECSFGLRFPGELVGGSAMPDHRVPLPSPDVNWRQIVRIRNALAVSAALFFSSGMALRNCNAQSQPVREACAVSGHATDALNGFAIKRASVILRAAGPSTSSYPSPRSNRRSTGARKSVLSGEGGQFCFVSVKPGQYVLSGRARGFLNTRYGAPSPGGSGRNIVVGPQGLGHLDLALFPESVISGKIVDPEGDPVSGAYIKLLMRRWAGNRMRNIPARGGETNDLGKFRIPYVSPGSYYIIADPGPRNSAPDSEGRHLLRTFYPGTARIGQASLVSVHAGDDKPGVVISLLMGHTYHVRGRVVGLGPTDHGALTLLPADEAQVVIATGSGTIRPDGSFDFGNVSPGTYVLRYFEMSGGAPKSARQTVTVGDGDVNVELPLADPATIDGVIEIEGTPTNSSASPFQNFDLTFAAADVLIGPRVRARVRPDGSFTVPSLPAGRYFIQAKAPAGTYLKSVLYGDTDVTNKVLDFTDGAAGQLKIIYRYGAATVTGTVTVPQNSGNREDAATGTHIVLIPTGTADPDGRNVMFGEVDQNSSFTIKQVPPGNYRAYAFGSVDATALHNPAVLRQLASGGKELNVKEGSSQAVSLPLTSSAQERATFGSAVAQ